MERDFDPEKIAEGILEEIENPVESQVTGFVEGQLHAIAKLAKEELERRHGMVDAPEKPEEWPKSGILSQAKTAEELGITEPELTPEKLAQQAEMLRELREDSED